MEIGLNGCGDTGLGERGWIHRISKSVRKDQRAVVAGRGILPEPVRKEDLKGVPGDAGRLDLV